MIVNDIDRNQFYTEDPYEPRKNRCEKYYGDPNTFIEYSDNTDDIYETIEDYNKKTKKIPVVLMIPVQKNVGQELVI